MFFHFLIKRKRNTDRYKFIYWYDTTTIASQPSALATRPTYRTQRGFCLQFTVQMRTEFETNYKKKKKKEANINIR